MEGGGGGWRWRVEGEGGVWGARRTEWALDRLRRALARSIPLKFRFFGADPYMLDTKNFADHNA